MQISFEVKFKYVRLLLERSELSKYFKMESGQLKQQMKQPKWKSKSFSISKLNVSEKGQMNLQPSDSIDELALKVFLIKGVVTGTHPRFDRLVKFGQLEAHPDDAQNQSEEQETEIEDDEEVESEESEESQDDNTNQNRVTVEVHQAMEMEDSEYES